MIIFIIYIAGLILNLTNIPYEKYDPVKIKKNRNLEPRKTYYNTRNMITLTLILSIFFILYDYCIYNFDIDLQKEYEMYNDRDLMFGKMNICQYATQKYIIDVLMFRYGSFSNYIYVVLFILLLFILYFTGLLEVIGVRLYDVLVETFNFNRLLFNQGYIENLRKLYNCRKPLMNNTLDYLYNSIF